MVVSRARGFGLAPTLDVHKLVGDPVMDFALLYKEHIWSAKRWMGLCIGVGEQCAMRLLSVPLSFLLSCV